MAAPPGADEDEEDVPEFIQENEEFEALDAESLKEAENWCHHVAHLLKQGRTAAWAPPEGEEEEEEEEEGAEEEAEPEEAQPMLTGLDTDALPAKGDEEEEEDEETKFKLWRFAAFPEDTQHKVSAAFSLNWPGAVAVAQGSRFANVYVGWGQKFLQEVYSPPPPPVVMKEYVSAFNPEEAEEGETDPMIEQVDPQPPKADEDNEGDEGDNDDDDDE
jgi:radial spoke head protein 4A